MRKFVFEELGLIDIHRTMRDHKMRIIRLFWRKDPTTRNDVIVVYAVPE